MVNRGQHPPPHQQQQQQQQKQQSKQRSKSTVVSYKGNSTALKGGRPEIQHSVVTGVGDTFGGFDSTVFSPGNPPVQSPNKTITHVSSEPDIIVGTQRLTHPSYNTPVNFNSPVRTNPKSSATQATGGSAGINAANNRQKRRKYLSGNTRQSYSVDHSATQPQLIDTPSSPLSQLRLDEYSETTPTTVHRDRERERERGPAPAATAASELRPSSAVPFHQSNVVLNYQQQSNISSNMCQMGNINRKRSAKFLKSVGHDTVADVIHHTAEQNAVDILLHAIDLECISVLKELLEVPTFLNCVNETSKSGTYPPDMTPLMLAAHRNNIEIIQLLFRHDAAQIQRLNVEINDAVSAHSNLNVYKALASPMYLISVHPTNPIHEALSLSYELHQWSLWEYEFHHEYQTMAQNVEQFALDLLDLTHPEELETLLVKGPSGKELETVTHAVELERKTFVASANFQVVLSPKWYGKSGPYLNKLRRMNVLFWYLIFLPSAVILTLIELPLSTLIYTFYPGLTIYGVRVGDLIRIPFIKFINHMASQMTFLFLLMQAASTSANRGFNRHTGSGQNHNQNYDLLNPSLTEWWICIWVMGMVWNELKQVHTAGLSAYFGDLWNRIDATMIVLYFSTLAFRAASYLSHRLKIQNSLSSYTSNSTNFSSGLSSDSVLGGGGQLVGGSSGDDGGMGLGMGSRAAVGMGAGAVASTSNYESDDASGIVWQYWDLLFLSEGVFALANIFSFMRLVTLATLSQHIGPMQISLSRMVKDVMKFMFIFFLVLLSFACGLHQLNWFFKTDCKHSDPAADYSSGVGGVCRDGSDKKAFDSLLMAMRTLFWALFNLSPPPNNIETSIPNNKSTPIIMFIVEAMYASYYVTAVIVLLRMLVAMMTTSYRDIESRADVEWKYARSKLWMTYIEEGSTLPPPVNLLPSMKWVTRVILQIFTGRFWKCSHFTQLCFKDTDKLEEQRRKDEYNYRKLIEKLIGRYRKEKARVNLIYPEETEEIGKSIVVLHTENRRLVSLIQRLTKDSEEHAKNWYYDYNVRNTYLNNNGNTPNPLNNHSSSSANHYHSSSFGGRDVMTPHDVNVKRRINSASVSGNAINYCNHLGMSPTGVELTTSVDDENSLIHRYNGQVRTGRLFAADDQEEVIVETDMSSCDSPVRQVFCQSGSSVDEGEGEGGTGASKTATAGDGLLSRGGEGSSSNASKGHKDNSGVIKDETRV